MMHAGRPGHSVVAAAAAELAWSCHLRVLQGVEGITM
jgi:hypothetical protein